MKYYLDITLLPDAEVNLGFLWQKVYQQLHLALVEIKSSKSGVPVGVSFPNYGGDLFPLGDKIRLFALQEELLHELNIGKWLARLTDYTHCTSIKEVPSTVSQFAYFKRKQFDVSVARLARRRAKRKGEGLDQALAYFLHFRGQESKLPFINMCSLSSSQSVKHEDRKSFKIFVEQQLVTQPQQGEYTCYGLSRGDNGRGATIPWFE